MEIKSLLLTVVPIVWGLIVKYHPGWKSFPNGAIPWVTFVAALLTNMVTAGGVAPASFAVAGYAVAKLAVPGFLGAALAAGWQAIQNSLIYEVFLRHPVEAGLIPVPKGNGK